MTQEPKSEPLVPKGMRPDYDPSADLVLQALRAEIIGILSTPFDAKSVKTAQALLGHAEDILMIRKGLQKPTKRVRSAAIYTNGDESSDEDELVISGGVLASAPRAETFGTHAMRDIHGAVTSIVDVMKMYVESRTADMKSNDGSERALRIESSVRALVQASNLPSGLREEITSRLRGELDHAFGGETIDAPPNLVAQNEPLTAAHVLGAPCDACEATHVQEAAE